MSERVFLQNKKAYFNYAVLEKITAGVVLFGYEVKTLREGKGDLTGSFVSLDNRGEAWVENWNLPRYSGCSLVKLDPRRRRKLLLEKKEIAKIQRALEQGGVTIVPLEVFLQENHLIKVRIALVRGKKKWDKRERIKRKEEERRMRGVLRGK